MRWLSKKETGYLFLDLNQIAEVCGFGLVRCSSQSELSKSGEASQADFAVSISPLAVTDQF